MPATTQSDLNLQISQSDEMQKNKKQNKFQANTNTRCHAISRCDVIDEFITEAIAVVYSARPPLPAAGAFGSQTN